MTTESNNKDAELLEKLSGGPMTLGRALKALRECEGMSLDAFGKRIGLSRQNLCAIENGRRSLSLERAIEIARALGHHEGHFAELAIQQQLDALGANYRVQLIAADDDAA